MTQNSRRLLRLGAILCLFPLALHALLSDAGPVHTLDLHSSWKTTLYTDLSGWAAGGRQRSIWPTDSERLLEGLRPGDRIRIHCRTFSMLSGDEAALLFYVVDGPAGFRLFGSVWNPLVLAVILVSTLLPFLICSILAIEADLRRDSVA